MENKSKRKRIPIARKNAEPAIIDPMEFRKNKCSDKARIAISIDEKITIDLWFDKHYIDRNQHGDDDGKRDGIDEKTVRELVLNSVQHLLFYSACVKNFTFLNHMAIGYTGRNIRVVCQEDTKEGMLNVIIEAHYKSLKKIEITVKTAMRTDYFKISDGQYAVEVINVDSSSLKLMAKGILSEVYAI